jgi:hypothetical protein
VSKADDSWPVSCDSSNQAIREMGVSDSTPFTCDSSNQALGGRGRMAEIYRQIQPLLAAYLNRRFTGPIGRISDSSTFLKAELGIR